MGIKNNVASLGELTFSLLKYRFSLWLFKSVLLHQFTQLSVGDAGLMIGDVDCNCCHNVI